MKTLKKILLFFFILFSAYVKAIGWQCGANEKILIEEYLTSLKLSPLITNNGGLIANIQMTYGLNITDFLLENHPALKSPDLSIDLKTLQWIYKIGYHKKHAPGIKYIFSPFTMKENNYGVELLLRFIIADSYPMRTIIPGFFNTEQLSAIKEYFKNNNFEHSKKMFMHNYNMKSEIALHEAKNLYEKIFNEERYIIEKDLKDVNQHIISLIGHGNAGSEVITQGHIGITFKHVVETLKNSGLPEHVNIELASCYGGCGLMGADQITKYSKAELIQKFINKDFKSIIGDKKESYAYKFSNELYSTWPEFTGSIRAYKCALAITPTITYIRNPSDNENVLIKNTFGCGFKDNTGKYIHFDKSEMQVIYTKSDFAISKK